MKTRLCIVMLMLLSISACGAQPWVKAYERGLLAEPVMSFNRDPISMRYRQHVYDVREGARGAGLTSGGGCGCN